MKKLLSVLLILALGLVVYAQDYDYGVDDEIPSQDFTLFYVGAEIGASTINNLAINDGSGFAFSISPLIGGEISPVLGIRPFSNTNMAVEINVLVDNLDYIAFNAGVNNSDVKFTSEIISPQILAIYTFGGGHIRPFSGLGFGANFNSLLVEAKTLDTDGSLKTETTTYDINTSFSMVLKSGVKFSIPRTNFDLYAFGRYNVNFPTKITYNNQSVESLMNSSNLSVAVGAVFNF